MHNPKLKHRLHRVDRADAVHARRKRRAGVGGLSRTPMRACCRTRAPMTIAAAGHAPHIEQPEAFAAAVLGIPRRSVT